MYGRVLLVPNAYKIVIIGAFPQKKNLFLCGSRGKMLNLQWKNMKRYVFIGF